MSQLLRRKDITTLQRESDASSLKRALGWGDLIMLSIGAVIGAGIFSSIGTAAAGESLPSGEIVRYGAGPALIFSFILLGIVCGLAALCYAELAAMIPQAGSAYTYSYATLGEIVAWIIGWDLILEYAVGNIAVAIAWSGYFTSLLSGFGIALPDYLTHGYRTALLSSNPAIHGLLQTAPRLAGIPILLNIPAALIVLAITWLLYIGVRESARANNIMVVVKLLVLGLFVVLGSLHIDPANYKPFAPNGWAGIHQGAAIVFFAYIGFDAISTAAEETRNPQRNMPIGILGGLAICTLIYVIVGIVATGLVPYQQLKAADPLARALEVAGLPTASWIVAFSWRWRVTACFRRGPQRSTRNTVRRTLPRW
jgi:APA family basic amino acid/polyamine antiporter